MRTMARLLVLAVMVALCVVVPGLYAATQNAVVYGTVYDAAGNPAANITVMLDNPAIGFSRTTATDSDGSYNFAEVPPAENYQLTASRAGQKIDARVGITVNVGDERVILPPLKEQAAVAVKTPGGTQPPVVVVAKVTEMQSVHTETVSTSISGVITGEQLRSLPVALNRNFLNAGLIPPDTHDVEQGSRLAGASFTVSGNRAATNNFLLDGADNVASSTNQAVPFQVNDAVQEFRVVSATANAEFGRNMGGVVNIVTQRGGNRFHGNAFGYFNADALNASSPVSVYNGTTFDKAAAYAGSPASTFNGSSPLTYNDYVSSALARGYCTNSISTAAGAGLSACPSTAGLFGQNSFFDPASILAANNSKNVPFDSNQFGVNAGGPFVKNKWFGFASYEGTLISNPNPIFERVPTAFDRTYAPYGTTGVNGQVFGFANTDPNYLMGQKILSLYPQSNVVGVPGVLEFFKGQAPNYTHVHNLLLRSDYIKSDKSNFSARYVVQFLHQLHDDTLPRQSDYAGNGAMRNALNQNLAVTYTHTFSSAWINESRLGFNRFRVDESPQDNGLNATTLGFPGSALPTILLNGIDGQASGTRPGQDGAFATWSDVFAKVNPNEMFPTLNYLFPFARLGAPLGAPLDRRDTTYFITNNTTWSHGRHSVKFGAEFRKLNNDLTDASFSRGFLYSSNIGEFTSDSGVCNEGCQALTGKINAFRAPSFDFYQQQNAAYAARLHSNDVSLYIQDSWRIHPRLTLNYGVRYEYYGAPEDGNNALYNFDPVANGLVQENKTSIIDPYGNPCGAPGAFQALPAGARFNFRSQGWICNATSMGSFNQITKQDADNFAPRFGLAWDVFGNAKTVFRAGAGLFYDQLPASYIEQLMYNRPTGRATNPNTLYGTTTDGVQAGFCNVNNSQSVCGAGNTIVQPAVQAASRDTAGNPNGLYTQAAQTFAVYARDTAHSETPYSIQTSATIQQQLTNRMTLEVGYIGSQGRRLTTLYNSNFASEFNLLNLTGGNFTFTPVFTLTNQANSSYNSLLVRLRAADWHGLQVNAAYNYSKSIDNASSTLYPTEPVSVAGLAIGYQFIGQQNESPNCIFLNVQCTVGGLKIPLSLPTINFSPGAVTTTGAGQIQTTPYLIPQNPFNFLRDDRGRSDFDSRHRVVIDYTWQVPEWRKSIWWRYWQMSGVFTAQSGQPFTIFAGPISSEATQRVNIVGPVDQSTNPNDAISTSGLQLATLSPACASTNSKNFFGNFLQPTPGVACVGDSGRNQFVGPRYINMNFAIQKGFPLFGEGHMLTLRTEFYNIFNHANFFNPISAYSNDGLTLNPDFGKIKSAHEPREIQFAVRYTW